MLEPARRDRRAEHERHHAGAEADQDAPQRPPVARAQSWRAKRTARRPKRPMPIAAMTTNRTPKRLIRAAANGAIRPKSARRMAKAEEMSAALQPNSCSSGLHQDARRAHRAGVRQHDEERRARHDPAVKDPAPAMASAIGSERESGAGRLPRRRSVRNRCSGLRRSHFLNPCIAGKRPHIRKKSKAERQRPKPPRPRRRREPSRPAAAPPPIAARRAPAPRRLRACSRTAASRWSAAGAERTNPSSSRAFTLRPTVDRSNSASRPSLVSDTVPARSDFVRRRLNCASVTPAGARVEFIKGGCLSSGGPNRRAIAGRVHVRAYTRIAPDAQAPANGAGDGARVGSRVGGMAEIG